MASKLRAKALAAGSWFTSKAWAVALGLVVLVALGLLLAGLGTQAGLLDSWAARQKAHKAAAKSQTARARAKGLDAQRARLLHEARESFKARARFTLQEEEIRQAEVRLEEQIQALSSEEVAARWNQLGGGD